MYDSAVGRVCPDCHQPATKCTCKRKRSSNSKSISNTPKNDGIVRVSRDRRNRRGKIVTVITGVPGNEAALTELAGDLKRLCGSGGTVKDGIIEIQGDHRDLIVGKLSGLGYRVKIAGG
ncbi:MAG: stress response translation initiation inhibitor YciH [Chloroflexota bacterium]